MKMFICRECALKHGVHMRWIMGGTVAQCCDCCGVFLGTYPEFNHVCRIETTPGEYAQMIGKVSTEIAAAADL